MRKIWMTALALAGVLLSGVLLATSASAEGYGNDVDVPCGYAFHAADWHPGEDPVPSANSAVSDEDIALVKVDGAVGTDAVTWDLDTTGSELTVHYELSGGATIDAGAVRFFAYDHADADTALTAPTYGPAIADAASGTLTLNIASGSIGTVGVTYDASNASTGTVTFTNLTLDGEEIAFIADCPETPEPTEPAPSESPSASPTPGSTGGDDDTANPTLPRTGSSLPVVLGGAAVLLGLGGGGLMLLARRKRPTFTAGDE